MRDRDTFSIGCVGFAEPSTKNSAGFQGTNHIGPERVRLLQLVRDSKPLPDPLFLIASHGSGGWRRITPEEIDWETSGIKKSEAIPPPHEVRIIQRWGDGQESIRLARGTYFEGEVHQMGLLSTSPFRITVAGLVIPMGGSIELEAVYSEGEA